MPRCDALTMLWVKWTWTWTEDLGPGLGLGTGLGGGGGLAVNRYGLVPALCPSGDKYGIRVCMMYVDTRVCMV